MNIQILRELTPISQRDHRCIWCPEMIAAGERYVAQSCLIDGKIDYQRWHPECQKAASEYFKHTGECELTPHWCKRGTNEEA